MSRLTFAHRPRSVIRSMQIARTQHEDLVRAYDLALPVVRKRLAKFSGANSGAKTHRVVFQSRLGGIE